MKANSYLDKKLFNEKKDDDANTHYPELDAIVKKLGRELGDKINEAVKTAKAETPYKAQYVLEELIKLLEKSV